MRTIICGSGFQKAFPPRGKAWQGAALLLLLFLPVDALAQGCSMCKAAVETNDSGLGGAQAIGRGLNSGILYLMAVPYLLIFFAFRKKILSFFRELSHAQG